MRTATELLAFFRELDTRSGRFSVSVKCYKGPEDLTPEGYAELRAELGLEGKELDGLPFGREWIARRFKDGSSSELYTGPVQFAAEEAWEIASEEVSELFGKSVRVYSEGRSGGHAVLHGIDAADVLQDAERFAELEEVRDELGRIRAVLETYKRGDVSLANRLAAEHGLPVPVNADGLAELQRSKRSKLLELARDCGLDSLEERLRSLADLTETDWRTREDAETVARILASSRASLGLAEDAPLPLPEDLEPETESGSGRSLAELDELADKLADFERFARSMVGDFPRRIAWHCGANVFEPELQESEELDARGGIVAELGASADRLARAPLTLGQVRDGTGFPADARFLQVSEDELRAFERARAALAELGSMGDVVSLRIPSSGRRPAVPCPGCGEPVRFK